MFNSTVCKSSLNDAWVSSRIPVPGFFGITVIIGVLVLVITAVSFDAVAVVAMIAGVDDMLGFNAIFDV